MNKLFLAAGLAALFTAGAYASPITYSTSTSQLCLGAAGCGLQTETIGNVIVTFQGTSATVDPASLGSNTTFGSFGNLIISCVGGGTACGGQSLAGLDLYINIVQTVPSSGNGSIPTGTIIGSVSGNASNASISWPAANTISIGAVTYSVKDNPLGLVPPTTNNGLTSVQAIITNTSTPEPSTYAMLAMGLMGVGLARRRR